MARRRFKMSFIWFLIGTWYLGKIVFAGNATVNTPCKYHSSCIEGLKCVKPINGTNKVCVCPTTPYKCVYVSKYESCECFYQDETSIVWPILVGILCGAIIILLWYRKINATYRSFKAKENMSSNFATEMELSATTNTEYPDPSTATVPYSITTQTTVASPSYTHTYGLPDDAGSPFTTSSDAGCVVDEKPQIGAASYVDVNGGGTSAVATTSYDSNVGDVHASGKPQIGFVNPTYTT